MSGVKLVRQIAARPDIVFDAITTPRGIAHWWGPDAGPVLIAEMDLRIGGLFKVRFRMLDATEHECSGRILEADGDSRVEWRLRPTAQGTELIFTHTQLVDDEAASSHERGWKGSFDKLERYVKAAG